MCILPFAQDDDTAKGTVLGSVTAPHAADRSDDSRRRYPENLIAPGIEPVRQSLTCNRKGVIIRHARVAWSGLSLMLQR
jgi:hypothetical protein